MLNENNSTISNYYAIKSLFRILSNFEMNLTEFHKDHKSSWDTNSKM